MIYELLSVAAIAAGAAGQLYDAVTTERALVVGFTEQNPNVRSLVKHKALNYVVKALVGGGPGLAILIVALATGNGSWPLTPAFVAGASVYSGLKGYLQGRKNTKALKAVHK